LRSHFSALACVRNTPPIKGRPARDIMALRELMTSLAAPGRDAKVPAALAADFVHAALRGTPYPRSILQRALLRERAEVTADEWINHIRRDARAALIKAVLIRDSEFHTNLEVHMDESRTESGYWLGALLAVLEDMQRLASGGVNASIKDKFYGAASATPAAVFPTMMDMFHKHARKARDSKPAATTIREKRVDAILHKLNEIPVHLDLKQQALFVLGYHHQRYALFNRPAEETKESTLTQEGAAR
jgi:CRISPR-associated protein Csd1